MRGIDTNQNEMIGTAWSNWIVPTIQGAGYIRYRACELITELIRFVMARTKSMLRQAKEVIASDGSKVMMKTGRKKRRFKPGTVARREIWKYQGGKKAVSKCVPKAAMERLIRETIQEFETGELRIRQDAIGALREGE